MALSTMTRKEKINKLRMRHSLGEIAKLFGISRQRVHAISGLLEKKNKQVIACELCGSEENLTGHFTFVLCHKCWTEIEEERE